MLVIHAAFQGDTLFLWAEKSPEPETALVIGHQEHSQTLTWAGGKFDVNKFDPREVVFNDPQERWKAAFAEKYHGA